VPAGETGRYVVKDPRASSYFQIGEEECFLLSQLDGQQSAERVCAAFAVRFGEVLAPEELDEFLTTARAQGFLETERIAAEKGTGPICRDGPPGASHKLDLSPFPQRAGPPRFTWKSILYWRINLFDPDRLFNWLEPKVRFFWTPAFVVLSAGSILAAAAIVWFDRQSLAASFLGALRWETAVLAWVVLFGFATLHEFGHGLTCKHHGGEVHELGFLMLLLMPCFYCNVSDAWMFREKSKRMWVTFAGAYFELFLWSLGVFAWRLTEPATLPHYLAFVVLSASGLDTLFNFNPLIKLDGYYLLSDWLEVPNLHERGHTYAKGQLRRLLWGAPRPAGERRGRLLLGFGLASWLYSIAFLALMLGAMIGLLGRDWGWLGAVAVASVGCLTLWGLFRGIAGGEVRKMILTRHKRTVTWLVGLGGLVAVSALVQMDDRAGASFRLRPAVRAELRAPVAGFLREISCDQGDRVSPSATVARIEVPDLDSQLVEKREEVREARARLRMLRIGPRPEEVAEQRERVAREKAWRDLSQTDLAQAREALQAELARLDKQIEHDQAELAAAEDGWKRANELHRRQGTISDEQYVEAQRRYRVAEAMLGHAQFQKRHREILGTREAIAGLDAQAELARREKDVAEAQAALKLLEAGSRPEEIEAQEARLARLEQELRALERRQGKLLIAGGVGGVIVTPRLKEKVGQYVHEGDLICVVEEPAVLEAEILLGEQEVGRVRPGQTVRLKARTLPLETLAATVERIAPAAATEETKTHVIVYCRLTDPPADLRPGMTGYARIYTGRRSIAAVLIHRVQRYVRTEFWW
jgi:multidrug efflux pump subunit AcrA (membrane-fusion protein)